MDANWRDLTDYQRCGYCGCELEGFVQEVMKGRVKAYVTCDNPACHPAIYGQTERPHIHAALCYAKVSERQRA